ncbi:MAG: HU family DNA-binding protein [Candidatus Sumerlaeota bacterium]|jgi:DNA-binding protein HU-beta|nr:HU family DNA-binding protein [Candidatus Sumerlaeota bacterium]
MTKAEVVRLLMEKTGLSRNQSIETLEFFLDSLKKAIRKGEKVCIVGFGTFYTKKKMARMGRNPRTGEKINIPPKRVAVFKPGKAFRELVNK